jgi:hypothetical protein
VIDLTDEQQKAYKRFITARNNVGLVRTQGYSKRKFIRQADVVCSVDITGLNHPLFEQNDDWLEYKEASLAWWAIEPEFRKTERMSAIRGDYGTSDNWEESAPRVRDTYSVINEEEQQP